MSLRQATRQQPCATSGSHGAGPRAARLRLQTVRCSDRAQDPGVATQPRQPPAVVVKSVPVVRSAAPPPQPLPVEHSSAFLLRKRRQHASADDADDQQPQSLAAQQQQYGGEPFTGSAVEWVLKKADQSLDEIEENPPEHVKVLYDISTGPIGKTASATVTTAAKVTVQVGAEALKAAAPVGKWALQQGVKLAVGAVASAVTSAATGGKKKSSNGNGKKR